MPKFIFKKIQKRLKTKAKILFLGVTFKEDVPDLRNSKAIELLNYLKKSNLNISINDPFVNDSAYIKYNDLIEKSFDAIIPRVTINVVFILDQPLLVCGSLRFGGANRGGTH